LSEREKILGRIREALQVMAPVPGSHHHAPGGADAGVSEGEAAQHIAEWLPRVGPTFQERVDLFAINSAELTTDFRLVDSAELAADELREIAKIGNWQQVATHCGAVAQPLVEALGLPIVSTAQPYDVHDLERCDAGISECDALIAQTGGVLVSTRSAGGRALSVLPPHHVVIARRDQLIADMPDAIQLLRKKYAPSYPSFISFITGPSRTGDIERILVLGAHGPRKLTVICY
jgi:L-lactate dehydrogenase complex protein LldG